MQPIGQAAFLQNSPKRGGQTPHLKYVVCNGLQSLISQFEPVVAGVFRRHAFEVALVFSQQEVPAIEGLFCQAPQYIVNLIIVDGRKLSAGVPHCRENGLEIHVVIFSAKTSGRSV